MTVLEQIADVAETYIVTGAARAALTPRRERSSRFTPFPRLGTSFARLSVPAAFSAEQGEFLVEGSEAAYRRLVEGIMPPQEHDERRITAIAKNPKLYNNGRSSYALGYSYAGYIKRQARRYPIMMYTLVQCVPCQRAKHMLAVNYSDVAAHFLEIVGHEDWQRQLQADLHRITGQVTFPYIFICGRHIGGMI
ncbi:unnamed protein product [Nippostrongylus brasiliensis]|uniref:Glutaredoxin domain-containing protein n=1 Tax=Nippostrongylus brasiliensis TaxID=27835 RepID=A0A0N4XYJ7_NIPBR|nr:unnamed protein product [Nippostrongylus brasiliensis]